MKLTIGFIGLGNMGSLLLNQMKLLNNKLVQFCIYDRNEHKIQANQIGYNINVCSDESNLISKSNIIFLSVKHAEYDNLLEKVKQFLRFFQKFLIKFVPSFKFLLQRLFRTAPKGRRAR